jgi:hypothetical protein
LGGRLKYCRAAYMTGCLPMRRANRDRIKVQLA